MLRIKQSKIYKYRVYLLMLLPAVAYFLIFSYLPMTGVVIAFKEFTYDGGIFHSPWVGLKNFRFFFESGQALRVTLNTVLYNATFLIVNTVLQLLVAIVLSELCGRLFKKALRSALLLPHFISWVIVGAFVYNLFNYRYGVLNTILSAFGMDPVDVYTMPSVWKYIIVFFNAWKSVGYGSIVYLAAILGIDKNVYEAADMDGANIFQKIRYITLPELKSTIIVMTLMSIGGIFRGDFSMFYQLVGNNGLLFNATDVIDTFVFRSLMTSQEFGMSAAVGLYQSVLCFILIVITNHAVKRIDPDSALF